MIARLDSRLRGNDETRNRDWPILSQALSATIVLLGPFHARTDLDRRLTQYGLSPRQSEIAAGAWRGLTNTEIARQISIGEQTVRDHFQEIYFRIGVHSRAEFQARVLGTNGSEPPTRRARGSSTGSHEIESLPVAGMPVQE